MDIIASHQHGLIEQLEIEAQSLGGRAQDSVQRAVVYHHLADSLELANVHALLSAHGALAIDRHVARMAAQVRRSWWRFGAARRAALAARVAAFGTALRTIDARRCEGALMAYRMVATPGLAAQARARLPEELIAAFAAGRANPRDAGARRGLFLAQQAWTEALIGDAIEQALDALAWPIGGRHVRAAVAALRIPLSAYARAEQRGLDRVEQALRRERVLPARFAANPAQAFFALQRQMAERRRRAALDGGDVPAEEAVRLAA